MAESLVSSAEFGVCEILEGIAFDVFRGGDCAVFCGEFCSGAAVFSISNIWILSFSSMTLDSSLVASVFEELNWDF